MNKVLALQALPVDNVDEAADNSPVRGSTFSVRCTGFIPPAE